MTIHCRAGGSGCCRDGTRLGNRREKIEARNDLVIRRPRLDVPRPLDHQGDTNSSFVEMPHSIPQGGIGGRGDDLAVAVAGPPIVRREEDQGIFSELMLVQGFQHATDRLIHTFDHRGKVGIVLGPIGDCGHFSVLGSNFRTNGGRP